VCVCVRACVRVCVCVFPPQAEDILRAWATPALKDQYGSDPVVTKIWNTTMMEVTDPALCPNGPQRGQTHTNYTLYGGPCVRVVCVGPVC